MDNLWQFVFDKKTIANVEICYNLFFYRYLRQIYGDGNNYDVILS